MKRLLSHVNTKVELTQFLARKTLEKGRHSGKDVVVAWGSQFKATHKDVAYLESSQEEADTKLLLHAIAATTSGATRFPELSQNTSFVTGRGQRHHNSATSATLPGFHAWSGADLTRSFACKGKLGCWKAFLEADEDSVTALENLGTTVQPTSSTIAAIEKLVCQLYQPKTHISRVKYMRWFLFLKKQAQSEKLPPTQAALKEAILRAHYQTMVWNNDKVPNPELSSPETYGWTMDKGMFHIHISLT